MSKIIPEVGLILKPINEYIGIECQTSEIIQEHPTIKGLWLIIEVENFSVWKTEEEINRDYTLNLQQNEQN